MPIEFFHFPYHSFLQQTCTDTWGHNSELNKDNWFPGAYFQLGSQAKSNLSTPCSTQKVTCTEENQAGKVDRETVLSGVAKSGALLRWQLSKTLKGKGTGATDVPRHLPGGRAALRPRWEPAWCIWQTIGRWWGQSAGGRPQGLGSHRAGLRYTSAE